ncbi:MAG: hypothetical protein HFE64_00455 [Lachnospiraceae bacterium]|jgi:hypothetical protein|nr:hypothetical protein [Lachnospiraceae bacterium]
MKKRILSLGLVMLMMLSTLTACHEHEWKEATCTEPKTCNICNDTEGEALGHDWKDATCRAAKTCERCGETEGDPLPHTWKEATCIAAKTCSVCGKKEGNALGHTWQDATCKTAKTCSVCGKTEGKPLEHSSANVTCTQDGTCDLCGEAVPATGHSWQEATCSEPKTCRTCGQTEGEALGHSTDNGVCSRCKAEIYATQTGSGDDVVSGISVGDGIYRVHFTNSGSRNFIVHAYDASNDKSYLVNEIGSYDGYVLLSGDAPFSFEVQSSGEWTFTIERLPQTAETSFSGHGDYVTGICSASSGTWEFTHDGSRNFIVHLYTTDGRSHLVNEIGAYNGKKVVKVPSGSKAFFVVQADGNWTIKPAA